MLYGADRDRCLFSDKYKTQTQYGQSVQLLNVKLLVHHVISRLFQVNRKSN
jgi:hypothetical protein